MSVTYLYLALAICAEVCGTLALKASDGFTRLWPSLIVVLCYAIAFYGLAVTLRTIPVGITYAIWSGMGVVLISAAGWVLFGQHLATPALVGMTLIVAGVLILNLLSEAKLH